MSVALRLVSTDDVADLTALAVRNLAFLAPWEPLRSHRYATESAQRQMIMDALARHAGGVAVPLVILLDGEVVGRVNLSDIVGGVFQSAHLGYWVSEHVNGRGIATAAIAALLRLAFEDYDLHRVQAGTLVHNIASQKVLLRNGFTEIGLAPRYLKIAGEWQDHLLFQRIAD